jgi:indole-3-glycerol phosphate synthase
MKFTGTILDEIVQRSEQRLASDKSRIPLEDMRKRAADMPPVISFSKSLRRSFGLIAEIKRRSPSQGVMRHQDISTIARAYQASSVVRAISVLTNRDDFGMSIEDLAHVRTLTQKPILRKDFIFDEYQVYEARAFGADAILLMANVVSDETQMRDLFHLAQGLGMDVLFECKSKEEIGLVPSGAVVYGINSRKMAAKQVFGINIPYLRGRVLGWLGFHLDASVKLVTLKLVLDLPNSAIKVAESGLDATRIAMVRDSLHYDAALVGTAILNSSQSVELSLNEFASALSIGKRSARIRRAGRQTVPV